MSPRWDRIVPGWRTLGVGVLLAVMTVACGKTTDSSGGSGGSGGKGSSTRCDPPRMTCKTDCVSIESDAANCGACGAKCAAGNECVEGICTDTRCPGGETNCGGLCVDTNRDSLNCAGCNIACDSGRFCKAGVCVCGPFNVECGGECLNDDQHCGSCDTACAPDEVCVNKVCTPQCAAPYKQCDGMCRDVSSDNAACGSCGVACSPAERCVNGACTCPVDSSHVSCDGACTDLYSDGANCGRCGNACPAGEACSAGSCTFCGLNGFFFCPSAEGDFLSECRAQAATATVPGKDAAPGGPAPDPTCQCNHCLKELGDCVGDRVCVSAWQCAVTKGCTQASCFDTMGACMVNTGPVGGCWKFCPPSTGTPATLTRVEALLKCTHDSGCGI